MFNLEQAIADWRKQMLAAGIKTPEHRDELESHLREEIAAQIKSGLNESQAFAAALPKIGSASALRAEFTKVRAGRLGGHRRLPGILTAAICVPLVGLIVWLGAVTFSASGMSWGQQVLGLMALGLNLLVTCQLRRALKFLPYVRNPWARFAAGISGVALGIGLFSLVTNYMLPHQTTDNLADLLTPLFWCFLPLAMVFCLVPGFMMGEREREIFSGRTNALG